jgi:4-amino-4-deoxy-L-arabinose transferase-like glycosyltransferase
LGYVPAVSAPAHANPSARRLGTRLGRLAAVGKARGVASAVAGSRVGVAGVSGPAWGAIATTLAFIALTCWWFTQDRSIPIFDVGDQLEVAREFHGMLLAGNLLGPLNYVDVYPALGRVVGAVAMFVGGVNVAAPTIGENVVFAPLLALGCYQTGRLLFGSSAAGMLAVVFAFGSPLLMSLFHVFLLDAPVAALVAVSVWLILASEDFSRVGVAGGAGLAVGAGMNLKVQFALFLAGLILVVLVHGGWRNRRGLAVFCAVAAVAGTPWYLIHLSELPRMFELASSGPGTPAGNIPPTLSIDNVSWYFWNVLNSQLLAPLFVFLVVGTAWMLLTTIRDRGRQAARLEFLLGSFAAWLAITLTPHHDIRYGLPLLGFLAVLATGWIAQLPRTPRLAVGAVLALAVAANTLGIDFGVGREAKLALAGRLPATEQYPDRVILFSTSGFLASAPSRDGDVPGLLQTLRREGVGTVAVSEVQSAGADFSFEGLIPLLRMAGLTPVITERPEFSDSPSAVTLIHGSVSAGRPPTCTRLSDGTGVWVERFDSSAGRLALYCPTRRPRFYDPGASG